MYKSIVATVEDFRKVARELPTSVAFFSDEVNLCDKALGDIRHFSENNKKMSAKKRKEVTGLLYEYSERRRVAKDNMIVLSGLADWITKNRPTWIALDNVFGEMRKQYKHVTGVRTYNPRVLKSLFEDEGAVPVPEIVHVVADPVEVVVSAPVPKLLTNSQIRRALRQG